MIGMMGREYFVMVSNWYRGLVVRGIGFTFFNVIGSDIDRNSVLSRQCASAVVETQ